MKNRRDFIKTISVLPLIPAVYNGERLGIVPLSKNKMSDVSFPELGTIHKKTPKEFATSPFGIGCETLDRELWDPKEIYPWMDDLPVKWARLQTGWARVEKEKGKYDWKWLDESIDGLLIRGFIPFLNVGFGNTNYSEGGMHPPKNNTESNNAWKAFIKALAIRYKNKIRYFEIWNEPNLTSWWLPGKPDAGEYEELTRETAQIIRKNCPGAKIIGGVLSQLPFSFIRSLFENGLGKEIDIFSFHPYGVLPESYNEQVKALRKLIDKYNPEIIIWQGETGYPSEPGSSGYRGEAPWSETIQAKIMLRRLITDCSLGMDVAIWFLIVDLHDYPKGSGRVNYKGILRTKPRVEPKIAFSVLQNLGSTIYGDVSVRNAIIHCSESTQENPDDKFKRLFGTGAGLGLEMTMPEVYSCMLNTEGGKIMAYWETVKAADDFPAKNIDILLSDCEGNGFEEPVLVDLMTGSIFSLGNSFVQKNDAAKWSIIYGAQTFNNLPLRDYPMLIVEKRNALPA